jgi:broad specificity phosphatase PhoE
MDHYRSTYRQYRSASDLERRTQRHPAGKQVGGAGIYTCELAGFGSVAEIDRDLLEWNYGEYEGRLTADIRAERPEWQLFRDGCPGGESPLQVKARADHAISRIRKVTGNVLIFSSRHFLRVLAARWIGIEPPVNSMLFLLSPSSLSAVGYDDELSRPVIRFWNDTHHVNETEVES